MVKEWNGMLVHTSEYEPKQPQLDPPYHSADAIALQNTSHNPVMQNILRTLILRLLLQEV